MRRLIHGAWLLFCLFIGLRFYQFYQWAVSGGPYTQRPPAVEAFLPIGALVSLKQFILTGQYDPLHPAGLTIFTAALVLAFLFRKGFCGWLCPVGFTSELLHGLANRATGRLRHSKRPYLVRLPPWLDYPLTLLKYLILVFFSTSSSGRWIVRPWKISAVLPTASPPMPVCCSFFSTPQILPWAS